MRIPARLTVMLVAALACSCAQRVYSVGTANVEEPGPASGATVQILREPTSEPSQFDEAIERKLVRALRTTPYQVAGAQDSDHFLYYDYRSYAMMATSKLEMLSGGRKGIATTHKGGPYVHSLRLTLVEADDEASTPSERSIVWEGGAVLNGSTESQKYQDLLIVAAVGQLGKTTKETVVARMSLNDIRARRLRK